MRTVDEFKEFVLRELGLQTPHQLLQSPPYAVFWEKLDQRALRIPVEELIAHPELAKQVPDEEWDKLLREFRTLPPLNGGE